MGKEKIKIYEYTKEGKYIRMYSDMSECRKLCFSEIKGKVPILRFKNKSARPAAISIFICVGLVGSVS